MPRRWGGCGGGVVSAPKPTPTTVIDEHGATVYIEGSDLTPATPYRKQRPRECWEHPAGVRVTPKATTTP